jgi:hypothetical protein
MIDAMANDDMLSLSMFWAGLLMVFAPIVGAGTVLGLWWRWRVRTTRPDVAGAPGSGPPRPPHLD